MYSLSNIELSDVQAVYSGAEGRLWELVMGEQIHIGGFQSSMDLAEKADIGAGMSGIDLCCCTGAGMRFLVKFRGVARMHGVDATEKMVLLGRKRCEELGLSDRITFTVSDVCSSPLPSGKADFVWGEDAWCYVQDKQKLISEAVRLVKPGGMIAFTDWVEGKTGLSREEANGFLAFMKFPSLASINDYHDLLAKNGCDVILAQDTGRFPQCVDLYLNMLNMQLTYDALKIIGFDVDLMQTLGKEMVFMQGLAHEGKITQGLFIARKGVKQG